MSARPKLLLLDDDQDLLDLYREILGKLPSKPEVLSTTSGARAIALLESEPFALLISDLNMPRMDGLQVLTIVKRKFPQLRTAVMTSVVDEQFRARAYSMGVDLFLEKPNTSQEINFFLDCIESLLGREDQSSGFRGVQSKSLVDIIQLECLSSSSSVLKIIQGKSEGKIWIKDGEIIDATALDLAGTAAFQRILSWRTGNFEILPPDPDRPRAIFESYQGLLLESSQAIDEQQGIADAAAASGSAPEAVAAKSPLAELAQFSGVEYVLLVKAGEKPVVDSWGLEGAEQTAAWVARTTRDFRALGDTLRAGQLLRLEAVGPQTHLAVAAGKESELCVGFHRSLSLEIVRDTMRKIVAKWAS